VYNVSELSQLSISVLSNVYTTANLLFLGSIRNLILF